MSNNILNDISKVYFESILESSVPGKPAEKLGAVTGIPQDEKDAAKQRTLAKAAAIRAKRGITKEGLDPVGKEDSDIDNDGKKNTKSDNYLLNRRSVRRKVIRKESYCNWRQDLSEVIGNKEENKKIVEKNIKNKIKINPNTQIKEAFETIGGSLLEMVEIDDFDCVLDELNESEIFFLTDDLIEGVVEEVFVECIDEGYSVFEIENTLIESLEISTQILNEAQLTFEHDTEIDLKEDRLQKVKSAVKKVARGIGYAAGAAVRGAKAIGREVRSGYSSGRGSGSQSSQSTSSSSRSKSSSGSSVSAKSSKPGLLSRIGSKLKRGLKIVIAKGARKVEKGASKVADRMERGNRGSDDSTPSPAHSRSGPLPAKRPPSGVGQKEKLGNVNTKSSSTTTPKKKAKPIEDPWGEGTAPPKSKKSPSKVTSKKKRSSKLDDLIASVRSEEYELEEKTLSSAENKKKEEIVKSMKKNLSGFKSRYGKRAREVMYATATQRAKDVAEASAPSAQPPTQTPNPKEDVALKAKVSAQKKELMARRAQLSAQQSELSKGIPLSTN
jgi:hypothetical protein